MTTHGQSATHTVAFADISSCGVCGDRLVVVTVDGLMTVCVCDAGVARVVHDCVCDGLAAVDERGGGGEGFLDVESMVGGEGLERLMGMGWMGDIKEVPPIEGESDEEEEEDENGGCFLGVETLADREGEARIRENGWIGDLKHKSLDGDKFDGEEEHD